jgi:hypothetical protein
MSLLARPLWQLPRLKNSGMQAKASPTDKLIGRQVEFFESPSLQNYVEGCLRFDQSIMVLKRSDYRITAELSNFQF